MPRVRGATRPRPPLNAAVGSPHKDLVGRVEEQTVLDHAGQRLSAAARAGRPSPPRSAQPAIGDEVAFVGDELPAVGAEPQGRRRHELQELPLRLTPAEPHDLDRQRATFAEVPHELVVLDDDEQPGGGAGQKLLAQERAAAALEQVEPGVDLVGAVHDQVEQRRPRAAVDRAAPFEIELVEGDDGKARRARQAVGLRRAATQSSGGPSGQRCAASSMTAATARPEPRPIVVPAARHSTAARAAAARAAAAPAAASAGDALEAPAGLSSALIFTAHVYPPPPADARGRVSDTRPPPSAMAAATTIARR